MQVIMIRKAFTLIELLIVVAIIAILAAIAVPNFLEAQMRSKVSRTLSDMRSLIVAMEAYTVDNNIWIWLGDGAGAFDYLRWNDYRSREGGIGWRLTTPISYITQVPFDEFNTTMFKSLAPHNNPHRVNNASVFMRGAPKGTLAWPNGCCAWPPDSGWNGVLKGFNWMLSSAGPDRIPWPANSASTYEWDALYYDPTNGSVSVGDICYLDTFGWRGGGTQ